MLTRLRNRAHGQEGFTLIELLVVILIIGILAAVAIPAFLNQKGKAQDANVKTDVTTAQTAEETYSTNNGAGTTYATTASQLDRDRADPHAGLRRHHAGAEPQRHGEHRGSADGPDWWPDHPVVFDRGHLAVRSALLPDEVRRRWRQPYVLRPERQERVRVQSQLRQHHASVPGGASPPAS